MSGTLSAYTGVSTSQAIWKLSRLETEKYFTSLNDKLTEGRATNTYPNF